MKKLGFRKQERCLSSYLTALLLDFKSYVVLKPEWTTSSSHTEATKTIPSIKSCY